MVTYESQTELNSGNWFLDTLADIGIIDKTYGGVAHVDNATIADSTVKGQVSPSGSVPKTQSFIDKMGDALANATKPDTVSESLAKIAKWAAIAACALGIVYIVHKEL